MKLIVGLGNPGREYEGTRHNVGWWVLDHLADVWHMQGWRKDGDARVSAGAVAGQKVRLVKPLTYMNLSGAVLRPYLRRESWDFEKDLLVVLDDAALPLGTFRFRARGSHGGHNGLRSIEGALGSRDYARLRVGVGPPPAPRGGRKVDLAKFVLAPLSRAERAVIEELRQELAEAIETWVREGIDKTMNVFNRARETESND